MPLYRTTDTQTGDDYLVEADNPSQAVRLVTAERFAVKPASATEVAQLMRAGVEVLLAADRKPAQAAAAAEPAPAPAPEPEPATPMLYEPEPAVEPS